MTNAVYATVEELKAQPGIASSADDATILLFLQAASRAVDGFCNEPDGFVAQASSTRDFVASGTNHVWVGTMNQVTAVSTSTDGENFSLLPSSSYRTFTGDPNWPNFNSVPFYGLLLMNSSVLGFPDGRGWLLERGLADTTSRISKPSVRVTGSWGYSSTVPELVKIATITIASRWFKRGQSFWSDSGGDGQQGQIFYRQAIDPDVKMMLQLARLKRPLYGG